MLEKKFGWRIRHIFASIIQKMRSDDSIQAYLRDYLKTVLSDEEIKTSVMGMPSLIGCLKAPWMIS